MKRRVCSYDMFAVPDPSFVLKDTVGEMYFCNLRCFCVWSVGLATRPNLSEEVKTDTYSLTTPSGDLHASRRKTLKTALSATDVHGL
jgi:hypothetical protein